MFFTLLFLTGNTMMQSVRERIPELAVLKTLGFTDTGVQLLVLGESLLLCVFAAAIGLGLAAAIFPGLKDFIGVASLPGKVRHHRRGHRHSARARSRACCRRCAPSVSTSSMRWRGAERPAS